MWPRAIPADQTLMRPPAASLLLFKAIISRIPIGFKLISTYAMEHSLKIEAHQAEKWDGPERH
jgi:hypothetical protein